MCVCSPKFVNPVRPVQKKGAGGEAVAENGKLRVPAINLTVPAVLLLVQVRVDFVTNRVCLRARTHARLGV